MSKLNIMVVGTKDGIVMVESGAKQISEEVVVGAIEFAHTEIKKIVAGIEHLVSLAGKTKRTVTPLEDNSAYAAELMAKVGDRLKDALDTQKYPKFESYAKVKEIKDELKKDLPEGDAAAAKKLSKVYEGMRESIFREQVLNERILPGPPRVRRDPQDHHRDRRSSARAWFGAVYARRDPGPCFGNTRYDG